jgi:hypothetical protein
MKHAWLVLLAASTPAFAQDKGNVVYQSAGPGSAVAGAAFEQVSSTPVEGAPYSATVTNQCIQTLTDGNRIVQTSTGATARDAQGRTRQDTVLPAIGNRSAANAPHLVFLHDPVTETSYTLNLTDKTAQKMPPFSVMAGGSGVSSGSGAAVIRTGSGNAADASMAIASVWVAGPALALEKGLAADAEAHVSTADLGTQTMEGLIVNGVRTTRTLPAGEMGNDKPISIVTEVWTSPDLKTIVYSKRSDPRMGEQRFQLTNIVRTEPDPSLFSVPADFKIIDGSQPVVYRLQP